MRIKHENVEKVLSFAKKIPTGYNSDGISNEDINYFVRTFTVVLTIAGFPPAFLICC